MTTDAKKFRWFKKTATTWASTVYRTATYAATITYDGTTFNLVVTGGVGLTSAGWQSLKLAKNAFRVFLHDKS